MFPQSLTLSESVLHLYQNYPVPAKVAANNTSLTLASALLPAMLPFLRFPISTPDMPQASVPQSRSMNTFRSESRPPVQMRNPSEPAHHKRTAKAPSGTSAPMSAPSGSASG